MKGKGRKIVKVEPSFRNKQDFLVKIWKKNKHITDPDLIEKLPLDERVRIRDRAKNCCVSCSNEATKQVSLSVKGGGALQLERYCSSCFDKRVDVDKMRMRV